MQRTASGSQIGYKYASQQGGRVIVTLEIPADARTNIARPTIKNAAMASQVADRVRVVAIEDEGAPRTEAVSCRWPERLFQVVGQEVCEPGQNQPEGPRGIHFQGSRERVLAEQPNQRGLNRLWAENGRLAQEWQMREGAIVPDTLKVQTQYDAPEKDDDIQVPHY